MRLPMIATTSSDITRTLTRCLIDWSRPLGDELAVGRVTTITNPSFATAGDANVAFVATPPTPAEIEEVNQTLAADGRRCVRWVIEAGAATFTEANWKHEPYDVYRLTSWAAPEGSSTIRIVSARAAMVHTEDLLTEIWKNDRIGVGAALLHLDDPRYELRVVLENKKAVACGGLLTSGDAGLLVYVYTRPTDRRRGYTRAIFDQLIDLAARAGLKHVLLAVEPKNDDAVRLYRSMGFQKVLAFDEWHAP